MKNTNGNQTAYRKLSTPRSAAIAGILFSILFSVGLILFRSAIPEILSAETDWVENGFRQITVGLILMPFAGIAFLWFIGVVRDLLGEFEDKFFSTVFLGSGLLFLAMVFVSMAIIGGLITGYRINPGVFTDSGMIFFGRALMMQLSNVYALRMAGVFMISLGTIWWRTGIMPRWLVLITYLLALTLMVVINLNIWITLVFPAWVFVITIYIFFAQKNQKSTENDQS